MVDLMSLEEGVDKDFAVAKRRAWVHGLRAMLGGRPEGGELLPFQEARRLVGRPGASGGGGARWT